MEIEKARKKPTVFAFTILGSLCLIFWLFFYKASGLFNKIISGFAAITFSLLLVYSILSLLGESKLVVFLKKIIGVISKGILFIVMAYLTIGVPLIIFITIIGIQVILYYLISLLFGFQFSIGVVQSYFMYLTSLLIFSYWGKYALSIFNKIFNNEGVIHDTVRTYIKKLFKLIHFRRRAYELMILLYIISVIEKFSKPIFSFHIWTSVISVALEVLLTFIAVDSYIQSFKPSIISRSNEF